MRGKAEISTYFGNYSRARDWAFPLGFADGRPAILVHAAPEPRLRGFVLLEGPGDRAAGIRDFRYAPYCLADAEVRPLDPAD